MSNCDEEAAMGDSNHPAGIQQSLATPPCPICGELCPNHMYAHLDSVHQIKFDWYRYLQAPEACMCWCGFVGTLEEIYSHWEACGVQHYIEYVMNDCQPWLAPPQKES